MPPNPIDPARLKPCESWRAGLPVPEIALYTEPNFGSDCLRSNCDFDFVGSVFNDKIKSVVVVSGEWQLYKDAHFKKPVGEVLAPGYYPIVDSENVGISAVRCIRC